MNGNTPGPSIAIILLDHVSLVLFYSFHLLTMRREKTVHRPRPCPFWPINTPAPSPEQQGRSLFSQGRHRTKQLGIESVAAARVYIVDSSKTKNKELHSGENTPGLSSYEVTGDHGSYKTNSKSSGATCDGSSEER